jgi:hypothetical protein
MRRHVPGAKARSESVSPTEPSPLVLLNPAERIALGIVRTWARREAQSIGLERHFRKGNRTASSIAGWRVTQLHEHFKAAGETERLVWLERVARGEVSLENDAEFVELRAALARVIGIIQGR